MNSESTLISLAMLKVNIDIGKDYLEYLRPLILRILKFSQIDIINDTTIAKKLREDNGLEIPPRTVQIVLQRLIKSGCLKKSNGVFHIVGEIKLKDWTSKKATASRKISTVVNALCNFAKETAHREIDDETAMECLIAFLSKFSIPCMKCYLRGTALPEVNGKDNWKVVLVSHFVQLLQRKQYELFEHFMLIVQGHMLANALLCPDLQSLSNTYKGVIFYFDTPLLIQYLGLEGNEKKQACHDLVSLVNRLDGKISYFTHTRDEMISVINGAADCIELPQGRGSIIYEARKAARTKSDLKLIAHQAVEILLEANITICQTPTYSSNYQIDESLFSNVLSTDVNYSNTRARDHDINSVRSIYALRKDYSPPSVEKSKAILVTNNTGLAKAAYEFGKNIEQSREVSTVITDFSLANTAWLKAPQGAPSLPQKEVLAFAYAALRPTSVFWEKVLNETEKLEKNGRITARDHQLIRSSHHIQEELMKLTLGEDVALSENTITSTLERVVAEIKEEESIKINLLEIDKAEVEQKLHNVSAKNESIKEKIYWRCHKSASREAILLSIFIVTAQLSIAFEGIIRIFQKKPIGFMLLVAAIMSGIVRISGMLWDIKPLKIIENYRDWRLKKKTQHEYSFLGINE